MEADAKHFHGTDSPAYRISERIRFGHNRFFLGLLSQIRGGKAFESSDRILDVGCGDAIYFSKLWTEVAPTYGQPGFVQGIDKEEPTGAGFLELPANFSLRKADFFALPEQTWDVVYSSFCHAWLRAPRPLAGTDATADSDIADRDGDIIDQLKRLIKPGGWFAAHYPGERDYFPYYNRLVLTTLNRIGHPLGDEKAYFRVRDAHVRVPHSIDETRKVFKAAGFRNHLLIKTIEWIPVCREHEFLAYWESGGKKLLQGALGQDVYEAFRSEFERAIASTSELEANGIETDGNHILLPTYHIYHIAQRDAARRPEHALTTELNPSWEDHTPLLLRSVLTQQIDEDQERIAGLYAELSRFLVQRNRAVVYLAAIEGGGAKRNVSRACFSEEFKDREKIVSEGAGLKLQTITNIILEQNERRQSKVLGVCANVADDRSRLHRLKGDVQTDQSIEVINFVWPQGFLQAEAVKQRDQNDGGLPGFYSQWVMRNDWPRLISASDTSFSLAKAMEVDAKPSKHTGPLHYFAWQSRVGGPKPFSFLVLPQRVLRRGKSSSHTGFLMWQGEEQNLSGASLLERILLLAMQPLAMLEVAEEEERLGRYSMLSTISHETKHVALAVRGWPSPIEGLFSDEGSHPGSDKVGAIAWNPAWHARRHDFAVVPMRELFDAATAYLVAWTLSDSPASLPFFDPSRNEATARTLAELLQKCWKAVLDVEVMHLARASALATPEDISCFSEKRELLNQLFPTARITPLVERDCPLIWINTADTEAVRITVWLARLFLHLCREQIQHAPMASLSVRFATVSGPGDLVELTWSQITPASARPTVSPEQRAVVKELTESIAATRDEFSLIAASHPNLPRGKDVKEFLVHQIDPEGSCSISPPSSPFQFSATFRWPAAKRSI